MLDIGEQNVVAARQQPPAYRRDMLGMDANPEEWLVAALPCGVSRGRQRGYREGQEYGGRANLHDLHMMAKGQLEWITIDASRQPSARP